MTLLTGSVDSGYLGITVGFSVFSRPDDKEHPVTKKKIKVSATLRIMFPFIKMMAAKKSAAIIVPYI
jgi:hypothetical protein